MSAMERKSTNGSSATLEGVLDETRAKAAPHPFRDASELTEKQAGNRIGWLARAN